MAAKEVMMMMELKGLRLEELKFQQMNLEG